MSGALPVCDHQAGLCSQCYDARRGKASGCGICGISPCYLVPDEDKTDLSRLSPECRGRWRPAPGPGDSVTKARKDGFYWVLDRRTGQWTVAKWNSVQAWWVLGWMAIDDPASPSGCTTDGRFDRIGALLNPPDEVMRYDPRPVYRRVSVPQASEAISILDVFLADIEDDLKAVHFHDVRLIDRAKALVSAVKRGKPPASAGEENGGL